MKKKMFIAALAIVTNCSMAQIAQNGAPDVASQPLKQSANPGADNDQPPTRSRCNKPVYPRESLRYEEEGVTRVHFTIDVDGRVIEESVEKSSGHERLDQAAMDALALCQFVPAKTDGVPQKASTSVDFVWKLPPLPAPVSPPKH